MDALRNELQELRQQNKRSRHLIWTLAVSLALDVLLSMFLAIVAVQAHHASDKATSATSAAAVNQQTQITTCKASNASRQVASQLWYYLLDAIDADPNETAQAKAQVKVFRMHVNQAYAQRDCSAKALAHSIAPPSK
jgi:flagellar basal body-associated protein FliL